jgi:hypothetical protein
MHFREVLFTAVFGVIAAATAFAQTTTSASDPTTRSMDEARREFDRMQTLSQQLHDSTMFSNQRKSITPVLVAIKEFRTATESFRDAVAAKSDVRDAVRSIERLFKPFDDYFDDLKLKVAPLNAGDFKDYSSNDLIWEALTTSERIDNNLQVSLLLLRDAERSGAIDIRTMQFMNDIQKDMLRLKFLAGKVGTIRRLTD